MSEINFIACNDKLEELTNSDKNMKFNNKTLRTMKKKKVNVFELCYPSTRLIDDAEFKQYNIKKKYVYALDYRWQKESIKILLEYFVRSMQKTDEIEFWSIWLSDENTYSNIRKKKVLINQLNYEYFEKFYELDGDVKCLQILNNFY